MFRILHSNDENDSDGYITGIKALLPESFSNERSQTQGLINPFLIISSCNLVPVRHSMICQYFTLHDTVHHCFGSGLVVTIDLFFIC